MGFDFGNALAAIEDPHIRACFQRLGRAVNSHVNTLATVIRNGETTSGSSAATTILDVVHTVLVTNFAGQAQVGVASGDFTIEISRGSSVALGTATESPIIVELGGGEYLISFTPLHSGAFYRTRISCAPSSVPALVSPAEFQDVTVRSL